MSKNPDLDQYRNSDGQGLKAIEMHATYLSGLEEEANRTQNWECGPELPCPKVEMHLEGKRVGKLDETYNEEGKWDAWHKEEDKEESLEQLKDAGVTVKPTVTFGVATHIEGRPWDEKVQPLRAKVSKVETVFYPNPQHVVAQTPTATATVSKLVLDHSAERFLDTIKSFVAKELLADQQMDFKNPTKLNIWSCACLFHSPPPFQASKGPHIEVVQAQPPKIDQYGCVSCPW